MKTSRFLLRPTGMGGFLSRTFHATRPGNRESYILKIGSENPVARNFSSKIHSFLRECAAYSLLPSLAGKVVPKCFSSCSTPDGADGLLCLQEVTRARSGDQIAGLSWKELAKTAKSIGIIHAHLWGSARKGDLPLHQYNRAHEAKSLLKSFLKEFRPRLSKSEIKRVRNIPKTVSIAIQQSKKRPITLIHGDLRADNLLFSKGRVFIVDWQIAAWGLGSFDLARVIGGSTQRPLSLSEQRKLVKIWHQTLKRKNVSGYSFEEAWQDYRIGVALTLSIPITNAPTLAHLSIRGKKIAHLMMRRFFRNGREFGLF